MFSTMSKQEYKQQYLDFDQYIRQGEPAQKERAEALRVAIGLQAVDGLNTSEYLHQTARKNIEGDITIDEARELIKSYYLSKKQHPASTQQVPSKLGRGDKKSRGFGRSHRRGRIVCNRATCRIGIKRQNELRHSLSQPCDPIRFCTGSLSRQTPSPSPEVPSDG